MTKQYLITLVVISYVTLAKASVEIVNGKIKITVGTTSACGDTVNFLPKLASVYEEFKEFLEVEFVPWGRTQVRDGNLVCQFGVNDCWANRYQRCALDFLKGDQDRTVKFMSCEFVRPLQGFTYRSYKCAVEVGINLEDIYQCVVSSKGDALNDPAREASELPMRVINFVPSIMFNDVADVDNHRQGFRGLRDVVCQALANDPSTGITDCDDKEEI